MTFPTFERQSLPILLLCTSPGASDVAPDVLESLGLAYDVVRVNSEAKLLEFILRSWDPREGLDDVAAILISETVGFNAGVGLIQMLSEMGGFRQIPILVLGSDKSDLGFDIWLQAGARGYVMNLEDADKRSSLIDRGVTYWSTTVESSHLLSRTRVAA